MPVTTTTRVNASTGTDTSLGTAEADAYRRSLERSIERFTPRQTHEINISPPITPNLWKPPGSGAGAGGNTPEARAREEEARAEGSNRIQRSRDFNDYVDLSQGRTTRDRPRTTGNFPNIERIPDLEWTRSTRSGGSAPGRNSRSGGGASWARNIDFNGGSSAAEAVVNDLIQQIATPYFEDVTRDSQRAYDDLVNQTRSNFENSVDGLTRLIDDFQDAIDNIPAPQPDTYPSPSLDCKHWVQFTRSASVATYVIEPGQYGFYSIEVKSAGLAKDISYEMVGNTWEVSDQYETDYTQDWTTVGSGNFLGDTERIEYHVPSTNVWESRSSGRLNPKPGINYRRSNTAIGAFRVNVVYPFAPQYNVEGDDMEYTMGVVTQTVNEFDPETCTSVEQDRRRPRPRVRDDDMQCLAPQLIGRLDRIIALMEHNVLTEAQIDQIAASAKGLKAQTKTLKALKQNMAIPEFWELKPGLYPQAAIVFGNKLPNGKIGRERRTLHIPHYTGREGQRPSIPEYDRGPFMARIILKDNSKMYCYARNEQEAIRVVNAMAAYTKQSLLPGVPPSTGKTGYAKSTWRAVPLYLQYYSDAKNGAPDWQVDFS